MHGVGDDKGGGGNTGDEQEGVADNGVVGTVAAVVGVFGAVAVGVLGNPTSVVILESAKETLSLILQVAS